MPEHDLHTFMAQDLAEMKSEYTRIRGRTLEDPGTAGDEGEEAWAAVLRDWLPESYQVRTKGRILGPAGDAGPQVDIVVLRPGYPKRLLDKKLYLAGGVAAVFECKNTLRSSHIDKTWQNVARVNELRGDYGRDSPYKAIIPDIFYGLLAHSHSWVKEASDPHGNILSGIDSLLSATAHMRDALSLVCVSDLGSWDVVRMVYEGPGLLPPDLWDARRRLLQLPEDAPPFSTLSYSMASRQVNTYEAANPLGVLIAKIVGRLAFNDSALQPLSQYFFASGMGGQRGFPVLSKRFTLESQYDPAARASLPHRLTNGEHGSEWSMVFNF